MPSKELIYQNKRKMDEASSLVQRLEGRLASGEASAAETRAIRAKLAELTGTFDRQVASMATASGMSSAQKNFKSRETQLSSCDAEQQHESSVPGSSKKDPAHCVASKAGDSGMRWRDVLTEKQSAQAKHDQERLQKSMMIDAEYREQQRRDISEAERRRDATLRHRPRSPRMYGENTTFDKIGAFDREYTRRQHELKSELLREQKSDYMDEQYRREQDQRRERSGYAIDPASSIIPSDRLDASGKPKTSAIPEKYMQGRTFDNASLAAPGRKSLLKELKERRQEDAEMLSHTAALELEREERAKAEHARHFKGADAADRRVDTVMRSVEEAERLQNSQRYGSLRVPTDYEVEHGVDFSSHNRTFKDVQAARHAEPAFGEGCFLDTIAANEKRRLEQVGPEVQALTPAEKKELARKEYIKRHPYAKGLTDYDIQVRMERETAQRDDAEARRKDQEARRQYKEELDRHIALKHQMDEELLTPTERCMNTADRYIDPVV